MTQENDTAKKIASNLVEAVAGDGAKKPLNADEVGSVTREGLYGSKGSIPETSTTIQSPNPQLTSYFQQLASDNDVNYLTLVIDRAHNTIGEFNTALYQDLIIVNSGKGVVGNRNTRNAIERWSSDGVDTVVQGGANRPTRQSSIDTDDSIVDESISVERLSVSDRSAISQDAPPGMPARINSNEYLGVDIEGNIVINGGPNATFDGTNNSTLRNEDLIIGLGDSVHAALDRNRKKDSDSESACYSNNSSASFSVDTFCSQDGTASVKKPIINAISTLKKDEGKNKTYFSNVVLKELLDSTKGKAKG